MRGLKILTSLLVLSAVAPLGVNAVTIVECVDANGERSFRSSCPPEMKKESERKIRGLRTVKGPDLEAITAAAPIVFYSVPQCDACDMMRQLLQGRGFPFEEKNVSEDAVNQQALKDATGTLTVPAVTIGAEVVSGYSRSALDLALKQAGYPGPERGEAARNPSTAPDATLDGPDTGATGSVAENKPTTESL